MLFYHYKGNFTLLPRYASSMCLMDSILARWTTFGITALWRRTSTWKIRDGKL